MVQAAIADVTARIRARSQPSREKYLGRVEAMRRSGPYRGVLGCANFAHGFAACAEHEKRALRNGATPNLAIVTAYKDMLSAHQPYERFPALIKKAAREAGGIAQVAGGVPAMCDGVTQGRAGMRLRQDRAGTRDRGASLRASARCIHPGGADAFRSFESGESEAPQAMIATRREHGQRRKPRAASPAESFYARHFRLYVKRRSCRRRRSQNRRRQNRRSRSPRRLVCRLGPDRRPVGRLAAHIAAGRPPRLAGRPGWRPAG